MYVLTCAGVVVNVERESTDDVAQPLLQVAVGETLPEGEVKHLQVGVEGVLVHGVDGCQVREDEEQYRSSSGGRAIAISEDFYFLGRLLCLLKLLHHLITYIHTLYIHTGT